MISNKLKALGAMLRMRPELAPTIAARLDELAECVQQLERAEVPPHLRDEVRTTDGVVKLDDARRRRPA